MSKNAWYGYRADKFDRQDHHFHPTVRHEGPVELRDHCPPVMDQGELGSCTAHGITGALRYERMRAGLPDVKLSRLQLYFDERKKEGTISQDAGAEIRDGIKCAAKIGVGRETLWPYNIKKFAQTPPAKVYADAVKFEALSYERVQVDASHVQAALAAGHVVVIGLWLYESFESLKVEKTGVVPMPCLGAEKMIGGHCLYVVGSGQRRNMFTVRNSWNTNWGDKGDCYFPFAYIGSPKFGSDYWIMPKVA